MTPEGSGAGIGDAKQTEPVKATEQSIQSWAEVAKEMGVYNTDPSAFEKPTQTEQPANISLEPEVKEPEQTPEAPVNAPEAPVDAPKEVEGVGTPETETNAPQEPVDLQAALEKSEADRKSLLSDIGKLRDRKNEERDRAEKATREAEALRQQLATAISPKPTLHEPFVNVNSLEELAKVEREYEDFIRTSRTIPLDAPEVKIGEQTVSQEQFRAIKEDAEWNLQREIPKRRDYLKGRLDAERLVLNNYTEMREQSSNPEFKAEVEKLVQRVISGEARHDPEVRLWAARAIRGWQYEMATAQQQTNGQTQSANGAAQKIVEQSKQKIAPTPAKARSLPEREPTSADLEKATKQLQASVNQRGGNADAALAWLNAKRSTAVARPGAMPALRR